MTDTDTTETVPKYLDIDLSQFTSEQITPFKHRVLSTRNDETTAHKVNTNDLTCSCGDQRYNKDEPEVCAHIQYVLSTGPSRLDTEDLLVREHINRLQDLGTITEVARDAADQIEQSLTTVRDAEAGQAAGDAGDGSDGSQNDHSPTGSHDMDKDLATDHVSDWIASNFVNPDLIDVSVGTYSYENQTQDCVVLDCGFDNDNNTHETWADMMSSKDGVYWDGDDYVNYVGLTSVEDVF